MLATQLKYKMMPAVYEENITQRKTTHSKSKSISAVYGGNIIKIPISKPKLVFSSLGLAIPFQPSMWDEKSIQSVWNNAIEIVKTKLKGRYSEECTNTVLTRLEKLFPRLNFNTHRKSLAIILTPGEERLIYLNFPVKPVLFFSKSVSLLDLAANMQQEADFYYFVLNEGSVCLYDYNNKQLRKVYEQTNETCPVNLFKNASNVIELLNSKNEKPVFVTGRPNMVEGFCNCSSYSKRFFTLLYHASPFSNEIIQSFVKEITRHWNNWQSKFIVGRVLLAQKANVHISNTEAVLQALRKSADGLLLMDKHLKHQLQKSSKTGNVIFQIADELISQIENFLVRGNRIEITETGLLKDMGGIVLLRNTASGASGTASYNRHSEVATKGELF